ncbi:hypothetical protein C1T31_13140 [Hanstruepera neustonica]|uniref:DUF3570 domain-containing protein n=1 Tax=Hanstruepera neustonica TaxID=1445657 RepID=A0A2K1DW73_9FLAO|nr:DUF3570 domain-containing protein [Hanstruepera neustonica]PNQ72263.1 hypothetical protein C1T31_13140 [Hanstruepera neustonica]
MRKIIIIALFFLIGGMSFAQDTETDNTASYKKRVLETNEVDFLMSYYTQDGTHAAVSGGIGTEKLTDITPTIVVAIPLNSDDVLTVDAGISAYSSASSSNINPFDSSQPASPYSDSSGASASDVWTGGTISYAHSSDSRNHIVEGHLSVASEYDYFSIGFGGSYTHLFNEKNTEISIKANVFLDTWNPQYPIELRPGFTNSDIVGTGTYNPFKYQAFNDESRNSYSVSISFSQILTKNLQASVFVDFVQQQGLLSTPHQRVYFMDQPDFFIDDFQLADDVERLPDSRFKIPIGMRLNYFLNERLTFRTYYRFYNDDWGVNSHTASIEVPFKISDKFTVYPVYRFYTQTAADYFAPYEMHLSTQEFYTSDYDLSKFHSHQYGFGFNYTDIFTAMHIWKFGLKSIDFRYGYYDRSDGLTANIFSAGFKFLLD